MAIKQRVRYGRVFPELERLGLNSANYYQWNKGRSDPQAYWLKQLALNGYDIYWILTGQRTYPETEIDFDIAEYEEE